MVPLLLTVMVTAAVLVVTVLPRESFTVTTGWVLNAEPLALPDAPVESTSWEAGPGTTVATCTGDPLEPPYDVTIAVRFPSEGGVDSVTVNWVEVALVTVPLPLLSVTVLFAATGSKPVPVMVRVVAVADKLPVF